jgi:hypothetical protein
VIYRMAAAPPHGAKKPAYKCQRCGVLVDITGPGVEVNLLPPSRHPRVICADCRKPKLEKA